MTGSMKLQPDDGPRYSLGIGPSSDDAVGSRRKFARRFAEGIGNLAENTKGDCREEDQRTYRKIVGVYGMGSRRKFARRFVERIGKLAGNAKGDRPEEDRRTCRKITRGCRSMREIRVACSSFRLVNRPGGG
ncbi:hypothetical protein BHM03_00024977 [Ensete ventricosum]|uniref:Uncharacterized protein n=1 Tax=Ensete ventricosum TaxID=4639 RepID=A0A445MGV1_ENSVE|nr:hypothetical protein BHM03_00024977 [Ensete ventricosum]